MRINMRKDDLRNIVRANRDAHEAEHKEAVENYQKLYIEKVLKNIELVKVGANPNYMDLVRPVSHVHSYDTALGMIDHSEETTVELDADSYRKLVEDNWEWTNNFKSQSNSLKGL